MAVDTAAKRFSLLDFGRPGYPMVLVPDGTVDRGDMLGLYAGLSLANPATVLGQNVLRDGQVHYQMADARILYRVEDSTVRYILRRLVR